MKSRSSKSGEKIIQEAQEIYKDAQENESENRIHGEEDLRFARLGEQWDEDIESRRKEEGRPCLTINRAPAFIRQVLNDARLNKPQIRVRPVDDDADIETADVYNGIIRHIEQVSNAGIAYDTAIDAAVSNGFGYMRLGVDFIHDDSFDTEPRIKPVENPFSIYGDPWSTAVDGSDWNSAFVVDVLSPKQFEGKYPKADPVDWESRDEIDDDGEGVTIVEYWSRKEKARPILLLSNGVVVEQAVYDRDPWLYADLEVVASRDTRSFSVTQRILSGADILEENEWIGKNIPIIPVYGERVNIKGELHLRTMIRDAKDAMRMFNYWRTSSTEIVALAPKAPFIGPKGSFHTDARKWETANSQTHPFIEYDGDVPPQRQPFAGVPAGMIQEALNASDDMKATIGIYDASLGARSNETSGVAIRARDRQGDVSTFHFIDNLSRGISYLGNQLVDIIPRVYGPGRVVRILGESGDIESEARIGEDRNYENPDERIYDLTAGNYDLVVDVGPAFSTRREEAATQMTEFVRSFPQAAPIIGDLLVKNLDWPGAEDIAERLKTLVPAQTDPMQSQAVQEAQQRAQAAEAKAAQLEEDRAIDIEKLKIEVGKLKVDEYEAQTDRMKVDADIKLKVAEVTQPTGDYFYES